MPGGKEVSYLGWVTEHGGVARKASGPSGLCVESAEWPGLGGFPRELGVVWRPLCRAHAFPRS